MFKRLSLLALVVAVVVALCPTAAPAQSSSAPVNLIPDGNGYKPAPGYTWVAPNAPNDLRVKWVPGLPHPNLPNLVSSKEERKWDPAPGYKWKTNDPKDTAVVWNPGARHPNFPGVVAQTTEGKWNTAPGYRWLNDDPGDLRTVAVGGAAAGNGTYSSNYTPAPGVGGNTGGPTNEQIQQAVTKVIAAAVANAVAQQNDNGDLGRALIIGLARKARDELIQSALADAFPNIPDADRRTLGYAASLALDGQLTAGNLSEAQAKGALKEWLKKQNPDMKYVVEGADFLYGVMKSRR